MSSRAPESQAGQAAATASRRRSRRISIPSGRSAIGRGLREADSPPASHTVARTCRVRGTARCRRHSPVKEAPMHPVRSTPAGSRLRSLVLSGLIALGAQVLLTPAARAQTPACTSGSCSVPPAGCPKPTQCPGTAGFKQMTVNLSLASAKNKDCDVCAIPLPGVCAFEAFKNKPDLHAQIDYTLSGGTSALTPSVQQSQDVPLTLSLSSPAVPIGGGSFPAIPVQLVLYDRDPSADPFGLLDLITAPAVCASDPDGIGMNPAWPFPDPEGYDLVDVDDTAGLSGGGADPGEQFINLSLD